MLVYLSSQLMMWLWGVPQITNSTRILLAVLGSIEMIFVVFTIAIVKFSKEEE